MAALEIQPLSELEVREQLEALGYHNFSPEKIKQITKDLADYLADEGLLTDTTDPSFVSDSTPQDSPARGTSRQPLHDIPGPSHYHQQHYVRYGHPDITGKENHSKRFPDGGETRAYYDTSFTSTNADETLYSEDGKSSPRVHPNAKPKPFIKRKVVRKRNGRSQVFDESVTESESDLSYINDRLADLRLPLRGEELQDEEDADSEASTVTDQMQHRRRPKSSSRWSDGASSSSIERYSSQPLKSFIRPTSAPPKWKHDKKTDPVTRHQMYAAQWKTIKAPGERSHKGLRWHIREQMLYKDDIVLPRHNPRIYVPNNYEVPTEKKRQALRWAVRNSLANREMPYSSFKF